MIVCHEPAVDRPYFALVAAPFSIAFHRLPLPGMMRRRHLSPLLLLAAVAAGSAMAREAVTVELEAMTSVELRARIDGGTVTALLPIGGTEQNGPHMVLGKHNTRARLLAAQIARKLGNAVVAPVLAYVPEGTINPPAAHMRFAGTVSIPEPAFEALLESAARSLCQHGLREVVFLGDHGGYQQSLERAAARVNKARAGSPACRAHALQEYYRPTQSGYLADLRAKGVQDAELGTHAGLADTALALALDKSLVRSEAMASAAKAPGVTGDPRRATAELGQLGVARIVDASVAAIARLQSAAAVPNSSMSSRR
jgi:creatinine amidohydrolase